MKLRDLRVNHIEAPMGFAAEPISFSWKAESDGGARGLNYARVRVWEGEKLLYDGGEDTRANSLDYRVKLNIKPRTRYAWSVEAVADNGERAEAGSWFETGKMEEAWSGKWITAASEAGRGIILRRTFPARAAGSPARLYICGLGVYEIYLNGKKVGEEYLAPGYHSYDLHLQVHTYDVTKELRNGENEIQIWLGDGWFKGRLGFDGGYTDLYGDSLYAIAELYVKEDRASAKEELILCTDEHWRWTPSPIVFSNIYDGEAYDARLESILHEKEEEGAVEVKAPQSCGRLCDRYSLPIVKKEVFAVRNVIRTPKGETVLDFGQNLTGWTEFDCGLPRGARIRLTAAEILQDGCFYHDNLRTAKTEFTYISDGREAHVRPHFTFFGFRYMKAEYWDAMGNAMEISRDFIEKQRFAAYHLRSDMEQIGEIKTGNPKVNQLFSNVLWGQKGNSLDVPTDCPQRDERLGWTGDAQVFSETACYNMYMPAFYRKYLWDMRAEQCILDGSVPHVVPRLKRGMVAGHGACPWADAGVIIPWNVYLHYGSRSLLEECYPGMKAWVDFQRRKEEAIGGPHLVKDGFHFADWLALDNEEPGPFGATDPLYIASAYYYRCSVIVAEAAHALGYKEDEAEYAALAGEILKAIRNTYFDEHGRCACETQTGIALAVEFGLFPEKEGPEKEGSPKGSRAGASLQKKVEENQKYLNTGFVGTPLLCPALTHVGHHKTAVDLLLNEGCPSWLYAVNLGATTVWERWDSVLADGHMNSEGMNSLNHYSYGSIEAWMYGEVCGIRPQEPGFKKAVIAPHPDERLGFADCVLDTAAGRYRSGWQYHEDGSVSCRVEVPFDAEAELVVDGKRRKLSAGKYFLNIS